MILSSKQVGGSSCAGSFALFLLLIMGLTTENSRSDVLVNQGDIAKMSHRTALSNKLKTIILKKVNFTNLTIGEVVSSLIEQSKQEDTDHRGIPLVLQSSSRNPIPPSDRITLEMENAPLGDVLFYVADQAHLKFDIGFDAVYIRPLSELPALAVMTFAMPAAIYRYDAFKSGTDIEQHFIGVGIRFPTGASIAYLPGSKQIVVKNTPEQLALMRDLLLQASKFD